MLIFKYKKELLINLKRERVMANMSYCRFQNTLGDFEDCVDALDARLSNAREELSRSEQNAAFDLIKRARELAEQFEDQSDDKIKEFLAS